jgi:hypothetical protein
MNSVQVTWRKFWALSGRERRLFIEAVLLHLWVGLLLKVIPFRLIPGLFASRQSSVFSRQSSVGSQQTEINEFIRTAIQRAGKYSPWKNRCLVSSLAGRCMLRRRKIPSQLSLGVVRVAGGRVRAHAWLTSGDFEIIAKSGAYTEMYRF